VSNKDGVAGSGFGARLVCDGGKGKRQRDGRIAVGAATDGAKDGKVVCDDRVSGPGI